MEKANLIEYYKEFFPYSSAKIEILHFNDVYNLEDQETNEGNIKGAARFATAFE